MNSRAGPIRAELSDALIGGIRQREPEAVGLVLIGLARLALTVVALLVLLLASSVLGFDVTAGPFLVMSGLSGLVSWLVTRGRWAEGKPSATVAKAEEEDDGRAVP